MEKDRKYSFTINGLTETISQVEVLSARLQDIEKQLDTLSNKRININVGSSGGGGGGRTTSSKDMTLEENKALEEQKQIRRQLTKEVQEMIAADRLQSNQYADTLNGMRQKLADLKRALGGVAVGSQKFDELIAETDALNSKVKELDGSYGVFQRNVGNYANSFREAMSPLQVTIQGIEYQFGSFREAMRALSMELATLKATGQGESERYGEIAEKLEEMKKQYKEIDSTLKDMESSSQVMDDMLDVFKSFAALASVSKGLSSFFGFDNAQMERSIQQLLALQNVLQGIEAIRQQMITKEGLGKYLASANSAINKFSTSLLGTKTALNGVAAAETQATVASKALGAALKGIGIGLLIAAIPYLLDGISKVVEKFKVWAGLAEDVEGNMAKLASVDGSIALAQTERQVELEEAKKKLLKGQITDAEYRVVAERELTKVLETQSTKIDELAKKEDALGKERQKDWENVMNGTDTTTLETINEFIGRNRQLVKEFGESTKKGAEQFVTLKSRVTEGVAAFKKLADSGELSNQQLMQMLKDLPQLLYAFENLDRFFDNSDLSNSLKEWFNSLKSGVDDMTVTIANAIQQSIQDDFKVRQAEINAMADGYEKFQKQHKLNQDIIDADTNKSLKQREAARKEENTRYLNELKRLGEQQTEQARRQQQELYDVEVAAMQEGLAKVLYQLQHEREERLRKASQNIKDVSLLRQARDTINATYDKKELEAREKHQEELEKQQREFDRRMADLEKESIDARLAAAQGATDRELQKNLDKERARMFVDLKGDMDAYTNLLFGATDGDMIKSAVGMYKLLLVQNKQYLDERVKQTESYIKEETRLQLEALKPEYESGFEKRKEDEKNELKELKEIYGREEITVEQFEQRRQEIEDRYTELNNAKYKEYMDKQEAIHKASNDKLIEADQDYYNWVYIAREAAYAKLNALSQKQPEVNSLGLPSLKKTKDNFKQIEDAYSQMLFDIQYEQAELRYKLNDENSNLGFDEFQSLNDQLESQKHEILESLNDLKQRMSKTAMEVIQEYVQVISQYSQMIGQTILSIMQSNNDLEDKIYQHRIDELNKFIDSYDEALQRQQEITERHNDALKSADEELDSARGDRRSQLIDIINAEVAAQRASLAEEKRIEKEKERLQKQVEQEEKKQREREWQRSLNQAIISGSLAIINGFATTPFVPAGLLNGALATMLTGIQIANIRAQRQYLAEGGILVGNSHKNGGIKVLGGRAELEGGEFVTNKQTTAKNADLLSYINSKKRRVTLSDMDDFFKGARNNFVNHSTKFASGGQLPNISKNVNDNLSNSIRQLIDRPVVVSVEEIDRVQGNVTRVRALAGAEE